MRFRGRAFSPDPTPASHPPDSGWGSRLAIVGDAIDRTGGSVRDVAVSVAGSHALVTALAWQAGYHRGSWAPIDFVVVLPDAVSGEEQPPAAGWAGRLRAVGDAIAADARDPLVLSVAGGWVVTATAPHGAMQSWEVAEP